MTRKPTSANKQKHSAHAFDRAARARVVRTQPARGTTVEFAQHSLPRDFAETLYEIARSQ